MEHWKQKESLIFVKESNDVRKERERDRENVCQRIFRKDCLDLVFEDMQADIVLFRSLISCLGEGFSIYDYSLA
jgi:hypothetical protein